MTTLDQAVHAAGRHARSAALRNLGVTACPYPSDGTPIEQAARQAWISQYLRARPLAPGVVDFRSDLDDLAGSGDDTDTTSTTEADMPVVPNVLMTLAEAAGPDGARLKTYWTVGKGAAKIRWKTAGDFNRCVRHLGKYVEDPEGLCNTYHQAAVGAPPGKGH